MAQPAPIRCQIQFGPFTADLRTGELLKYGIHIKLQERPFVLLAMLLDKSGEVVTREEMRARLWPDGTFVDYDNNISSAIGKLRAALGDSAAEPRYVETVGRGYRFIAEVNLVSGMAEQAVGPTATPELEPRYESTAAPLTLPQRHWLRISALAALLAVAAGIVFFQWSRSRTSSHPAPKRIMLAVLPFANLTGDPAQDYFSDGLTEEMITQLGSLDAQHLGVIARTSVMRYKNSRTSLPQISAELGVHYVLEGSVRRDGNTVRITAQLIQVRDQTHLWAREYDRELKDLLAVQTEIAQEIGDEIQLALGGVKPKAAAAQASLSPQQVEAYDLYLKGEYFFAKRTIADLQRAIDFFQQSIARDPAYARAYAALADSYILLGEYSELPASQFVAKARAAAVRALQLDERLPDAHTALALVVQNYDWDWQTAEKEFRRAIELDPNYVTAHHWYAEHLMWRGRFEEALQESEKARQLDPLSLIIGADNGVILYYSRRYDGAIQQFHRVLTMDRHFPRAHMIVYAYVQKGMFAQALADIESERPSVPLEAHWYWSLLAYVHGRAGHRAEARHALLQLQRSNRLHPADPLIFVWAYLGLGAKDEALHSLQKAYATHSNIMATINVEPAFDPLRSDPRFQQLLERVGLSH